MNDYCDILSEINRERQSTSVIESNINNFMKHITSVKSLIKSITSNFLPTLAKLTFTSPFNKLPQSTEKLTTMLNQANTDIDDYIVSPCAQFIRNISDISEQCTKELYSMSTRLIASNQQLTKVKMNYLSLNKKLKDNKLTDIDAVTKLKSQVENALTLYNYEIEKMNKVISESNMIYDKIRIKTKANNDTYIAFVRDMMLKYYNIITNLTKIPSSFALIINEVVNDLIINNNFISASSINKASRFPPVEVAIEENFTSASSSNMFFDDDFEIISNKEIIEIKSSEEDSDEFNSGKVQSILVLINKKENIVTNELTSVMNFFNVNNNAELNKIHIEYFLNYLMNTHNEYVIENKVNFEHFCNIINSIAIQIGNNDISMINEKIVTVAEKTKCGKRYLCDLLAKKNNYFRAKSFWLKLIKDKIVYNVNVYVKKTKNFDSTNTQSNLEKKVSKGKKWLKKIKKVFKKEKNQKEGSSIISNESDDNSDDMKLYILENNGYANNINNYANYDHTAKTYIDSYAITTSNDVIIEYIRHMCNFGVNYNDIVDIINDISNSFTSLKKDYYMSMLNTYKNTIKTSSLLLRTYNVNKTVSKSSIVLSHCMIYLNQEDKAKLLFLSKSSYQYIKNKYLYYIFSSHSPSISTISNHINIWASVLNVNKITRDPLYNYSSLKSLSFSTVLSKKTLQSIDLDVSRTSFLINESENRNKLTFILRCVAYRFPQLGYCQGMSYFVSFLLQLFSFNESKTLSYVISIVKQTKYDILYDIDLRCLKRYFYIVDTLIKIYYPKIAEMLMRSKSLSNFFSPPWFLTLFTNISVVFTTETTPLCVLMIWDNFMIRGYNAVLLAGMAAIDYEKNRIEKFEQSECFEFMVNRLIRSECFKNENFEQFKVHYENVMKRIDDETIEAIGKCYEEENKNE